MSGVPDQYNIYPVPNQGLFTVSITTAIPEEYTIEVYDQMGRKTYGQPGILINGEFRQEIDLQQVPPGLYLVVMKSAQNVTSRKIEIIR